MERVSSPSPASSPTGGPAQRLGPARRANAHCTGRFRRRALQRLMLAGATVLAMIVVLFAASAIYILTPPSVGKAEQRVQRILALHHGTYSGPAPPARLGDAVVAVEDEHFYSNFLINILDGAGRAALATLHTSEDPGGSTIAQQLAKQL